MNLPCFLLFFTLILLQLFSFRIIPGPPRLAIAICGARTLVKIFFRKFIIVLKADILLKSVNTIQLFVLYNYSILLTAKLGTKTKKQQDAVKAYTWAWSYYAYDTFNMRYCS